MISGKYLLQRLSVKYGPHTRKSMDKYRYETSNISCSAYSLNVLNMDLLPKILALMHEINRSIPAFSTP